MYLTCQSGLLLRRKDAPRPVFGSRVRVVLVDYSPDLSGPLLTPVVRVLLLTDMDLPTDILLESTKL